MNYKKRIEAIYPANSLQQGFIYHSLSQPEDDAYQNQLLLDYKSEIDAELYERAWNLAIRTYPILRTYFNWKEEIIQIIDRGCELKLRIEDIRGAEDKEKALAEIVERDRSCAFDLRCAPLLRLYLVHYDVSHYVLLQNIHHSISDGWSNPILFKQVHQYYAQLLRGEEPKVIEDRSYLHAQAYISEHQSIAKEYWRDAMEKFEHANDLSVFLHGIKNIEEIKTVQVPQEVRARIDDKSYEDLKKLSQSVGLTINILVQFAWHKLIQVYTRDTQTIVGTTVSGRALPISNIENSIGMYINTLPLMIDWSEVRSVRAQLQLIAEQIVALNEYSYAKLSELQRDGYRLFHSLLIFENYPFPERETVENILEIEFRKTIEKVDYPLNLLAYEKGDGLEIVLKYEGLYLETPKAERLLDQLESILVQIPPKLDCRHQEISLLTAAEYHQIAYEWNATQKLYPSDKTIYQLFEAQVGKTPDEIAVKCGKEALTYRMLSNRVDQLTYCLVTQNVQRQTLVVLLLDRGINYLSSILSIWKLGAFFVPLNPDVPEVRNNEIIEQTNHALILTEKRYVVLGQQLNQSAPILQIENSYTVQNIDFNTHIFSYSPVDLAYIIFTSGSTGKPKGAMVHHKGAVNHLFAKISDFHITQKDNIAQTATQTFDVSIWQFVAALMVGGRTTVLLGDDAWSPSSLLCCVNNESITLLESVPSHLLQITEYLKTINNPPLLSSLRCLMMNGEGLPPIYARHWFDMYPHIPMANVYGPTECSDDVTHFKFADVSNAWKQYVPIGKPIANMQIYILDGNMNHVPVGIKGEIFVAGVGVGGGYLNLPDKTKQAFIVNPFIDNKRQNTGNYLYKTGDIARWLPDGNVEYIGREDFQVKIRGQRIELGEIEYVLSCYDDILACVVVVKNRKINNTTEHCLIAYYVSAQPLNAQLILCYLTKHLPNYMIPSMFVHMNALPLSSNGKLNRSALPEQEWFIDKQSYLAPRNDVEAILCTIWEKVLGIKCIGINDDFYRLGGHSILAIQMSHRVSQVMQRAVSVIDIYTDKTISNLSLRLKSSKVLPNIEPQQSDRAPLSFAQERLWFIEQYEEGTSAYHIPGILELMPVVNVEILQQSLQMIIARHEILRTHFIEDENGEYWQSVETAPLTIVQSEISASEFNSTLFDITHQVFDLTTEYPIRAYLFTISKTLKRYLVLNIHHIAIDEWSIDIFIKELECYYHTLLSGKPVYPPALKIQYKDFSVWQKKYVLSQIKDLTSYWQHKLAHYQPLALPTDYLRPSQMDYKGAYAPFELSTPLSLQLHSLARSHDVTVHTLLLAGLALLLSKYSGQTDLIIGMPVANRQHPHLADLIGFFINTLPLRIQINSTDTVKSYIEEVQKNSIEIQDHQDLPFEKLVESLNVVRDASRHPLFQVVFTARYQSDIEIDSSLFQLISASDYYQVSKFDLMCAIQISENKITGKMHFATALFKSETIQRFLLYYVHFLQEIVTKIDKPINQCQLLTPAAYAQIIYEWNATEADFPRDKTLHELFEEQVLLNPDRLAVMCKEERLTYQELNERSNQVAYYLKRRYAECGQVLASDSLIGLCIERSLEQLIGMLGILKAGGAYVPIDPSYPTERISYLVDDSKIFLILTQQGLVAGLSMPEGVDVIALDACPYLQELSVNLGKTSVASDLAYVTYTSGTTGFPKGVEISHQSVCNLVAHQNKDLGIGRKSRVLHYTPIVFDVSVSEIFCALSAGAALHIISTDTRYDTRELLSYLETHKITMATLPPALLPQLRHVFLPKLATIVVAGEVCKQESMSLWSEGRVFVNAYGPTEATVYATSHHYKSGDSNKNIGRPLPNVKAYVLDAERQPVPIGVIGELYIGGAGLARGYLHQEALTSERFIENPFVTEEDKARGYTRLYKTGDRVRWLEDGNLEYIGRSDFQVKLRGYRIELGEIEGVLNAYPGVSESVVLCIEESIESGRYLVGYYVSRELVEEKALRKHLESRLPEYMHLRGLQRIEQMPLTINGKIDRRSLPLMEFGELDVGYVGAQTLLERQQCEIWKEVLGVSKIGVLDDFFQLGGDSIKSIQVSSRLQRLGIHCRVKDIFVHRCIREISGVLGVEVAVIGEQGVLSGRYGLLPIQRWFFAQGFKRANHWNQSFLVRVPKLSLERLEEVLPLLVKHHDMLRARYEIEGKEITQIYGAEVIVPEIQVLNVSGMSELRREEIFTQWQSGFDLASGPLWQIGYVEGYSDGYCRLYFAFHHLIVDSVSWRIFVEDMENLYKGSALGLKGSSYRAWVGELNRYKEIYGGEEGYWEEQLSGTEKELVLTEVVYCCDIRLDRAKTRQLLGQSHGAYHTEINDLLLTGLCYALRDCLGGNVQRVTLEGHGREDLDGISVSRTIGWFTSMYPIRLKLEETLSNSIQGVKEYLRKIPNKGIGYGVFAYSSEEKASKWELPKITFNYLGQLDNLEGDWRIEAGRSGVSVHEENARVEVLSVVGWELDGIMRFKLSSCLSAQVCEEIGARFISYLQKIIEHCAEKLEHECAQYTPSDFKDVHISRALSDELQDRDRHIAAIYPANSLQQGFIYHSLSQPGDDAYQNQLLLDYKNEIDAELYERAWNLAIQTYPILRTYFNWKEEIIQIIGRGCELKLRIEDIRGAEDKEKALAEIVERDRSCAFDLRCAPLLRLYLVHYDVSYYVLLQNVHHSISDGWSNPILFKQVHQYYAQLLRGEEPKVIEDRSYLHAQAYISEHQSIAKEYWRDAMEKFEHANDLSVFLHDIKDLEETKTVQAPQEAKTRIDDDIYKDLKRLSQSIGLTINILVQFAWHKLIQVYTRDTQTTVGTTVSGRALPVANIENSVGMYINTLPMMIDWREARTVRAQLQLFEEQIVLLNEYSFVKLSELQKDGYRLFHSLLVFENYPFPEKKKVGDILEVEFRKNIEKVDYPLNLVAYEKSNGLEIVLKYEGLYLEAFKAEGLLNQLELILIQIPQKLDQSHQEISLLTMTQYQQIVYEWNATKKSYPNDKTISQLFEAQVEKTPDDIAIVRGEKRLSYAELHKASNQLAHYIHRYYEIHTGGLKRATLIALCMGRSIEFVIGVLGVLKAGAAYVLIDRNYPEERIAYILEDTGCCLVFAESKTQVGLERFIGDVQVLEESLYKQEPVCNVISEATFQDLAYVIYTSGTTGKPKGVMISHQNVSHYCDWLLCHAPYQRVNRVDCSSSPAFDFTVSVLFVPLLSGKKIILCEEEIKRDASLYIDYIQSQDIELIKVTPSYLSGMLLTDTQGSLKRKLSGLKCLILGGEKANIHDIRLFRNIVSECDVINHYGPTETTVGCISHTIQAGEDDSELNDIPLGRIANNSEAYILDTGQKLVPIGAIGELYIGGSGVGLGYLNQSELSAEKFIINPFSTASHSHLYKTGDLVRYLPNGTIEYIGRNDSQVKIRGYRIELGEIERTLLECPLIKQVVVVYCNTEEMESKRGYLVAYYISDIKLTDSMLRAYLEPLLPAYMHPNMFILLDALPLTKHGKLDYTLLPKPESFNDVKTYVEPKTELEKLLCRVWQEVLGIQQVGIQDDFFNLGGDSIRSIQLVVYLKRLGIDCRVMDITKSRCIERLAQVLVEKEISTENLALPFVSDASDLEVLKKLGPDFVESLHRQNNQIEAIFLANSLQQGFIYHALSQPLDDAYRVQMLIEYHNPLNIELYERAWIFAIQKYPILRTYFNWDEVIIQIVTKAAHCDFTLHDSRQEPNKAEAIKAIQLNDRTKPFDLSQPGLLRLHLIWHHDSHYTLLKSNHHSILDGWSERILFNQVHDNYLKLLNNEQVTIVVDTAYLQTQAYISKQKINAQTFWQRRLQDVEYANDLSVFFREPINLDEFKTVIEPGQVTINIEAQYYDALKKISHHEGVTLNALMQFAWHKLIEIYTRDRQTIVGTTIAGRLFPIDGIENSVGLYINTLPLVMDWDTTDNLAQQLYCINERISELNEYSHVDLASIQRDGKRLFHSLFVFENYPIPKETVHVENPLSIRFYDVIEKLNYPLGLFVSDSNFGLHITLKFDRRYLSQEKAQRLLLQLKRLIYQLSEQYAKGVLQHV